MQWNVSDGKTHHINTQTIYNESNALLSAIALDKCEKWRQQTEKKKKFIHKDNFFFGLMVRQTQTSEFILTRITRNENGL